MKFYLTSSRKVNFFLFALMQIYLVMRVDSWITAVNQICAHLITLSIVMYLHIIVYAFLRPGKYLQERSYYLIIDGTNILFHISSKMYHVYVKAKAAEKYLWERKRIMEQKVDEKIQIYHASKCCLYYFSGK